MPDDPKDLERQANLRRLATIHELPEWRAQRWITEGTTFAAAAAELVNEKRGTLVSTLAPSSARNPLGLSEAEQKRYSIRSAVMQLLGARGGEGGEPAGFETEVSRALERYVPGDYARKGGILIPTGIIGTRAGLDTKTQFKGEEAVFTEYGGFIELLRARAMVLQLGATFLPGLQGNVAFVKQTGAAVAEWVAENPGADISDTELSLALVTLIPKTLMGSTFFSRQLLRQAAISVDTLVETDLVAVHARALDRAAIHGSGVNNEPEGVYLASGVNAVAFDGPITFPKVVQMETAIAESDGDVAEMAYLTTPSIRGIAKVTPTFAGMDQPIWTGGVRDGEMNGYRAAASTQVRSDLGPTPTPTPLNDHGLVFGAWRPGLVIGEWGILELIVDEFTKKKQALIEVTSFQMADVAVLRPEQFSKATGLTLT